MRRFHRSVRFLAWTTLLLALPVTGLGADEAESSGPPLAEFGFAGPRAELLLLGTFHFQDSGQDDYKPKHGVDILSDERQREVADLLDRLEKFAPTKIGVEVKRSGQARLDERYRQYLADEIKLPSNELFQIGFRLARRLGHERVWAVDADGRRYEPSVDRKKWAKQHDQGWVYGHDWHKRYEKLYEWDDRRKTEVTLREHLIYLNSPQRIALGHGHYLVGGFKTGDGEEYPGADHLSGWWYDRNLRIFANLLQLAREEDDRVLLVIGAGHLSVLRHAALSAPDVELVEVADVLGGDSATEEKNTDGNR